jgi:hypothetical protein
MHAGATASASLSLKAETGSKDPVQILLWFYLSASLGKKERGREGGENQVKSILLVI